MDIFSIAQLVSLSGPLSKQIFDDPYMLENMTLKGRKIKLPPYEISKVMFRGSLDDINSIVVSITLDLPILNLTGHELRVLANGVGIKQEGEWVQLPIPVISEPPINKEVKHPILGDNVVVEIDSDKDVELEITIKHRPEKIKRVEIITWTSRVCEKNLKGLFDALYPLEDVKSLTISIDNLGGVSKTFPVIDGVAHTGPINTSRASAIVDTPVVFMSKNVVMVDSGCACMRYDQK